MPGEDLRAKSSPESKAKGSPESGLPESTAKGSLESAAGAVEPAAVEAAAETGQTQQSCLELVSARHEVSGVQPEASEAKAESAAAADFYALSSALAARQAAPTRRQGGLAPHPRFLR